MAPSDSARSSRFQEVRAYLDQLEAGEPMPRDVVDHFFANIGQLHRGIRIIFNVWWINTAAECVLFMILGALFAGVCVIGWHRFISVPAPVDCSICGTSKDVRYVR